MQASASANVLAITAGITDLQPLVRTDDGRRCRVVITRNNRRIHEALLSGHLVARISADEADEALPERTLELPDPAPGVVTPFDPTRPLWLDREQLHYAEFERDGESIILVAPKLGHVWRHFNNSGTPLDAVIVYTTRRDAELSRYGREEPIALGKLLTEWLRPLCRNPPNLRAVEYLQGREILEDTERRISLSFVVARRIESALHEVRCAYPNAQLTLAISGGQPVVKEFVAVAASLYFDPERIRSALRPVDGVGANILAVPGPTEEARVRRIALWHVRHGGFVEAHAVALEFHNNPNSAAWVRPLAYAANLINQNLAIRSDTQASPPPSLRRIAKQSKSRALIPALRTEAALQGAKWPEAINWTLTFFDAFLLDAIETSLPISAQFFDRRRLVTFGNGQMPDPALLGGDAPPLKHLSGNRYESDTLGAAADRWIGWIGSPELDTLRQAVAQGAQGASPRSYRNLNTHNRLTRDEINEACATFQQNGLWAAPGAGPGGAFLAQTIVRNALDWLLNVSDSVALYRDLVADLEELLLEPPGTSTTHKPNS